MILKTVYIDHTNIYYNRHRKVDDRVIEKFHQLKIHPNRERFLNERHPLP